MFVIQPHTTHEEVGLALSIGQCVLDTNAFDVSRFELTQDHLHHYYGLPPQMEVDYHGTYYLLGLGSHH